MGFEYRVNGGTPVDVGNALSVLVGSLLPGTAYTFDVRSYDGAGGYSNWVSVSALTPNDNLPPSVPAGLTVTATGETSLHVEWEASTDVEGTDILAPGVPTGLIVTATGDTSLHVEWEEVEDDVIPPVDGGGPGEGGDVEDGGEV